MFKDFLTCPDAYSPLERTSRITAPSFRSKDISGEFPRPRSFLEG